MQWLKELQDKRASGSGHCFLLYLGVRDQIIDGDQLVELPQFLQQQPPLNESTFAARYNRGEGIQFMDAAMEKNFLVFLGGLFPEMAREGGVPIAVLEFRNKRKDASYMLWLFTIMLSVSWDSYDENVQRGLREIRSQRNPVEKNDPFFSVVLGHEESLTPPSAISGELYDRNTITTLLHWATNQKIGDAQNTVIMLTEQTGAISEELTSTSNGILQIEIPFPDLKDRTATIKLLRTETDDNNLSIEQIARISAGLSRRNLAQLTRLAAYNGNPLSEDEIFYAKKEYLEQRGKGMIELYRSTWGLEAIGGLEDKKVFISETAKAMRDGNTLALPQGILFLGPPGTGKSVCIQALAYESRLPFARLKNIMEMWVGQSERNQDFIFRLIESYGPLIIVIDEFDQMFPRRDMVFHGDSGVNARQQQRFMEIMSDTDLRGHILWIGITNRPDLLDAAFLREGRFDDKLVFLPPSYEERIPILPALLEKLKAQERAAGRSFEHNVDASFYEEFAEITHAHFEAERGWYPCDKNLHHQGERDRTIQGYTGAEMETIVVRAVRRAQRDGNQLQHDNLRYATQDFLPTRNMAEYQYAIDAALRACNSIDAIPALWREQAWEIRGGRGINANALSLKTGPSGSKPENTTPGQYL